MLGNEDYIFVYYSENIPCPEKNATIVLPLTLPNAQTIHSVAMPYGVIICLDILYFKILGKNFEVCILQN